MEEDSTLMRPTANGFHVVDYIVFSLFMLISLSVGVFFSLWGGRQRSTSEYLMGNRQMGAIPVGISMAVSFVSALTLVGHPAEIYVYGYMYVFSGIGLLFGFLTTGLLFVQVFFPLRLTSPNEYLAGRFRSPAVGVLANIMATASTCLYMGLCMYAPAIALSRATGGRLSVIGAFLIGGAIGTTYTTIGGLKAVVWSDVIQSGFMLAGMVALIVRGLTLTGGLGPTLAANRRYDRIHPVETSLDPRVRHTLWGMLLGGASDWGSVLVMPASVQRLCSLPSLKNARQAIACAAPTMAVLFWLSSLAGLSIAGYYLSRGCDMHAAGWTTNGNEISPYFVMDRLNFPGFPGLFIAAMYAGSLSTLSSGLSATSAALWRDILKPYMFRRTSDVRGALITKLVVLVTGALSLALGYFCMQSGGLVLQTLGAIDGSIRGPYYGLFWLSALFPIANRFGAMVGPVAGFAVCLWLNLVNYLSPRPIPALPTNTSNCLLPNATAPPLLTTSAMPVSMTTTAPGGGSDSGLVQVSYIWILGIGALTTVVVGLVVSAISCAVVGWTEVDQRYLWGPMRSGPGSSWSARLGRCCMSAEALGAYEAQPWSPKEEEKEEKGKKEEEAHRDVEMKLL